MAAKTKKTARVRLELIPGQKNQHEFFSVNFKNYRVKRGEYVEVPEELAKVIEAADTARNAAVQYANSIQMGGDKEQ